MDIDLEDLQGQPGLSWDQLREEKTPETPSFAKGMTTTFIRRYGQVVQGASLRRPALGSTCPSAIPLEQERRDKS